MTDRGLLIVLSGPSGVGKDTVLQQFLQNRTDCILSVSATTRPPREGEADGVNYYFMPRAAFERLANAGEMLEYAEYSGNLYGTPAEKVEERRRQGKHVILEIEVQGALQVREKCPDAVLVFLMPPSVEVLRRRLQNRGTESPEVVEKRMAVAEYEMAKAAEYDYIIVNRSVDESCVQLGAVITAAGCSVKHMQHLFWRE